MPKVQSLVTYVPGRGPKVALCIVVESIAVPADEKYLVLHISGSVEV